MGVILTTSYGTANLHVKRNRFLNCLTIFSASLAPRTVITPPECSRLAGLHIGTGKLSDIHLVTLNAAVHLFMRGGCAVVRCECCEGMCRGLLLDEVLDNLDL